METGQPRAPEQPKSIPTESEPTSIESRPDLAAHTNTERYTGAQPQSAPLPVTPVTQVIPSLSTDSNVTQKIEKILSEGMEDTYLRLDPETQRLFRTEGEKTAAAISRILSSAKIKVRQIILLILSWLQVIPGVNRFYIEQEAKIKADKILALRPPGAQ